MTFDDGILVHYEVSNGALAGEIPVKALTFVDKWYYKQETIGVARHYEAIRSKSRVDLLVSIHYAKGISINDVIEIEDTLYEIEQKQDIIVDGLKTTKLALKTTGEIYEKIEQN